MQLPAASIEEDKADYTPDIFPSNMSQEHEPPQAMQPARTGALSYASKHSRGKQF